MSIIAGQRALAINETVQNALAGQTFEFLAKDSTVKAGFVATAAGTATFQIGDAVTVQNAPLRVVAANTGIRADEDLLYVDAGRAGSRLILTLANGGAVSTVDFYVLII